MWCVIQVFLRKQTFNLFHCSKYSIRLQRGMKKWKCVLKRSLCFLAERSAIGHLSFWTHIDGLPLGATHSIKANWQQTHGSERMTANTVQLTQKNHPRVRLSVSSSRTFLNSMVVMLVVISVFHRSLLCCKKTTTNHYKSIPQTQIYKRLFWCHMIVSFLRK